jgi:hypothetical protein
MKQFLATYNICGKIQYMNIVAETIWQARRIAEDSAGESLLSVKEVTQENI